MSLDHDFFQKSKLSEDQIKVFAKKGTLFSPNSTRDLCSDAHQSQSIEGDADVDHTQIIGRIYPPPPPPPGFGTPGLEC